ncbi:Nif11-like leader peptide family natural product precursor [Cyanobium sp. T1B-Tous]|nr:Nif11-like leader peptide family natural product precursor [Cyanobium sp. T1B-Tous]MCX5940836.1 Nif11-like leader peptide family natural product precursor [Cyanobium sp. LacPavin_0818_WC50_MAG_67_9]
MSWSELERLVDEAEGEASLRRALGHCRSQQELVLAARRLGYRITRVDLQRAWLLHRRQEPLQQQG